MFRALAALTLTLSLPVGAGAQLGAGTSGPAPVRLAAVLGSTPLVQGESARLAVEIRVIDGYHVNANPASADWLIPTRISIAGAAGVSIRRIFYPDASEGRFPFFDGALRVYEGAVVAGVLLDVTENAQVGEHSLRILLDYQACDDAICFAPARAELVLPVILAPAGAPSRRFESPLLDRARFEPDDEEPSGG